MKTRTMSWQRIGILIAAVLGISSAFLPWVTCTGISKSMNGFNGVGFLASCVFMSITLISLLYGQLQLEEKTFFLFTITAGIAALLLIIMQVVDLAYFLSLFTKVEANYNKVIWVKIIAALLVIIFSRDFKFKKPVKKIVTRSFENGISIPATFTATKTAYAKLSIEEKTKVNLERLHALKQGGYITEEEFQQLNSKLVLSDFFFGLFN